MFVEINAKLINTWLSFTSTDAFIMPK